MPTDDHYHYQRDEKLLFNANWAIFVLLGAFLSAALLLGNFYLIGAFNLTKALVNFFLTI